MNSPAEPTRIEPTKQNAGYWYRILSRYQQPSLGKSLFQILNSVVPYFLLWYLMYLSLNVSYWLTLALAFPAAGFLVRTFIIFHDCVHGSFFKSQKANQIVGFITGALMFTTFETWRDEHNKHHQASGNLDDRGYGCVWTMTVKEYENSSVWTRIGYRFVRNPLCLFLVIPPILFLILHRFPSIKRGQRGWASTHLTNALIVLIIAGLVSLMGWKAYLLIQIPVLMIAASAGVWLFYVQHQFDGVYWERGEDWDFVTAALKGSSFYKLPRILQWFTGNIGFHHIHHLNSRIPNYYLEKCHNENPAFQQITPITLRSSLRSLNFRLWDEDNNRLVGFEELKKINLSCK